MKRLPWITALLLMSASTAALAAPDSCERKKRHSAENHQQRRAGIWLYAEHRTQRSGRSSGCAGCWALCQ